MKIRATAIVALATTSLALSAALPAFADSRDRKSAEKHWAKVYDDRDSQRRGWTRCDDDRGPPPWARAYGRRGHDPRWVRPAPTVYVRPAPLRYAAPVAYRDVHVRWDREVLGSVIGGAAGGILGSHIGRGTGNAAAIIGGTVLGVMVGGSVGRTMDTVDRLQVAQTLEYAPTREVVAWQNPDSLTRYEVTPVATYQRDDGRYCREYQTTATIGGQRQQVYGTACRQPDGSWEVVR